MPCPSPLPVRAVFFDYDGVMTTEPTGSHTTCRHLALRTGVPFERWRTAFAPFGPALNLGATRHAAVWTEICRAAGCVVPLSLLEDAFLSTPRNEAVVEVVRIFEHALRALGVRPEEAVFIDNDAGNLPAAQSLGLHTIWFDDAANDVAGLRRTLARRFGAFGHLRR